MTQSSLLKLAPVAALVALFGTWQVQLRGGNEEFLCDGAACTLGSSASWLLTGVTLIGPFVALAGFFWTRHLHYNDRLGPFSPRGVPDSEQILEVVGVLIAALISYWLLLNGPSIEAVKIDKPNTWVENLREFRAPEQPTTEDSQWLKEVPTRFTWFIVGSLLSAPFAFSLGSMIGREWYGRKRRQAQQLGDVSEGGIGRSTSNRVDIDLTDVNLASSDRIDDGV